MPDYRRHRVPGGTFFFTVNLLDRRSDLLVTRIDALRDAVRKVRGRTPFHIEAWVVLPDHMHRVWTPALRACEIIAASIVYALRRRKPVPIVPPHEPLSVGKVLRSLQEVPSGGGVGPGYTYLIW
jgi:REP element-mobilizing transposase RayT